MSVTKLFLLIENWVSVTILRGKFDSKQFKIGILLWLVTTTVSNFVGVAYAVQEEYVKNQKKRV